MQITPTKESYDELQLAYDHFNRLLFSGSLPPCLITLQREKHSAGYYSPGRFFHVRDGNTTDEIAMNPLLFGVQPVSEILQTLVHEMAHLWQEHFGSPGRGRYHNHQWANKMEEIGLMPSDTGKPGGKRVGDKMADYVIAGGTFEIAVNELVDTEFRISWADRFLDIEFAETNSTGEQSISPFVELSERSTKGPTRMKYTCSLCRTNLWGKPQLNIICGDCNLSFCPSG